MAGRGIDTALVMYIPPGGGRGPAGGQRAARPPLPCYKRQSLISRSVENGIEACLLYDLLHSLIFAVKRNPALAGLVYKQQDSQTGGRDIVEAASIHIHGLYGLLCFVFSKKDSRSCLFDRA